MRPIIDKHIFYERRLDYKSILSRSGRAVAHDEERRAFERLGNAVKALFRDWWRKTTLCSRPTGH